METLPKGRLGVNLVHGQQKVSRVVMKEAFNAGWRVGDVILSVNGRKVTSNAATQKAVRSAVKRNYYHGGRVKFEVRRWGVPDGSRSMLQFTTNGRRDHLVPMLDIAKGILQDFHIVLFMEGTLKKPKNRLTRQVIKELDDRGMPFKAVDCTDEKINPGIRNVTEQLAGEKVLPQLFIDGAHVAGGRALQDLSTESTAATPESTEAEAKRWLFAHMLVSWFAFVCSAALVVVLFWWSAR
ncbi:GRXS16 [Symbiodinium pilosum]|uniref:GRXS16 protein n=1 Tax=Symbiodinium pilosum TaxID=2952 RepID=A0A812Y2Z9_SYMPI|nr:GRXS16 [Symbiodinium pilosum]